MPGRATLVLSLNQRPDDLDEIRVNVQLADATVSVRFLVHLDAAEVNL